MVGWAWLLSDATGRACGLPYLVPATLAMYSACSEITSLFSILALRPNFLTYARVVRHQLWARKGGQQDIERFCAQLCEERGESRRICSVHGCQGAFGAELCDILTVLAAKPSVYKRFGAFWSKITPICLALKRFALRVLLSRIKLADRQ